MDNNIRSFNSVLYGQNENMSSDGKNNLFPEAVNGFKRTRDYNDDIIHEQSIT